MKSFQFLFVWFFLFSTCFAQKQNIKFSTISPEKGLSHSNVTSIVQDRNGFMWFGTKDGLNKYDGYTFTVYKNNPDNVSSLANNFIQDMVLDKEGNLWIGSWGGLTKFDTHLETFTQYKHNDKDSSSIPNDIIVSLLLDKQGNFWIGTLDGLVFFNPNKNVFELFSNRINDAESLSDNFVRDVFIDHKNQMWVATFNGGLNLFNPQTKKFKRFMHDENNSNSLNDNCVYTIFEDSKNRLWIGTHKNGFDLYDQEKNTFKHFTHDPSNPNSLVHNAVSFFEEDVDGYLWIGTENGGISIFNPENNTFTNYVEDDFDNTSLSNNSIYAIFKDNNSNIWVGTYSGGINFHSIEASKFRHYKHNSFNSLSNNNVLCFFEDFQNNLWIGTDGGGVDLFDRKNNKFYNYKNNPADTNSIAGDYIVSIAEDSSHNIWFGTYENSVSIYNPISKKFRNLTAGRADSSAINCNIAWKIYKDKVNNMWVGTIRGDGLYLFDNKTNSVTNFHHDPNNPKSLSNNYINSIFEDSQGNIWIGTNGGGLNWYNKKTKTFEWFKTSNDFNSISSNEVDCVFEDSKGNLWIGTNLGLDLMDRNTKTFTSFSIKEGMPDNVVFGILEDPKGFLWISTTKGLTKFDPVKKSFSNYTLADGLQSHEFKSHSYCKSKTGAFYFGGTNGFNEFIPDSLDDREPDSPILITDFKIFNKSVSVGKAVDGGFSLHQTLAETKTITLTHDQSYFSFEFAALNYTLPEKNLYAYKLEGLDKDWNYIGNRRLATYTNVPPGKYTFRVKGSHNNNIWVEKKDPIHILISPPFYGTWWFRTLAALTLSAMVLSFYSFRINIIQKQKLILENVVQERTLDLREASIKIKKQRDDLKIINENVMSSINYAKSIQKGILTTKKKIRETVADCFIIYKPKDIVSGDFYWFSHLPVHYVNHSLSRNFITKDQNFIAAIDCTGHGVAGAFMSIIGNTLFNEIINQKFQLDPAEILESLDEGLKKAIAPTQGIAIAGMDVCLCKLEKESETTVKISFAGARRPLYYVKNGCNIVHKINGDIVSIGSDFKGDNYYTTHEIILEKGSMLYLTTDGFADQCNAAKQKIGTRNFEKILTACNHLLLTEQIEFCKEALNNHQNGAEQRDDITLIGVRV